MNKYFQCLKITKTTQFCVVSYIILYFYFLTKAAQTLPIGTAYAVWTGIGAAGTIAVGIFFYNEPAGILRLFFLFTLVASIVGLKLVAN